MKKIILITLFSIFLTPASFAEENTPFFKLHLLNNDTREVKSLLNAQVRYANRNNFDKFINTYDKDYVNSDGFDLKTYSDIVKDVWKSYDKIKYGITPSVKTHPNASFEKPFSMTTIGTYR